MEFEFDIFISYSNEDKKKVRIIASRLKKFGYRVWLDEWEINVGEAIFQKVFKGIESSRFMGVWLTKNSIASGWVEEEWMTKFASKIKKKGRNVLPLLAEKGIAIPFALQALKYADFTGKFSRGFDNLIKVLASESDQNINNLKLSLIIGTDAENCAKELAQIAISQNNNRALDAIWEAITEGVTLHKILDHCAYSIGKIVNSSKSDEMKLRAWNYIKSSASHSNDFIIEKFAYTSALVYLREDNTMFKDEVFNFILENLNHENLVTSRCYKGAIRTITNYR